MKLTKTENNSQDMNSSLNTERINQDEIQSSPLPNNRVVSQFQKRREKNHIFNLDLIVFLYLSQQLSTEKLRFSMLFPVTVIVEFPVCPFGHRTSLSLSRI